MKKAGYRPEFAAAVAGAGSVGGLIMPPVMGAAAFLIAEFLGISYGQVIVAAFIPAVLYYVSVWTMVHLEAKRVGMRGLEAEELPSATAALKARGHLLLPVGLMVYLLVNNYTPLFAGYWAIVTTFALAWLWEEARGLIRGRTTVSRRLHVLVPLAAALVAWGPGGQNASVSAFVGLLAAFLLALLVPDPGDGLLALRRALENGARGAVGVALATAIVGFVVGTASLTSLGLNVGNSIVQLAGDSLPLALLMTMVTCIVVGTGIPTTPMYIIVALVAAPALIKMEVPPLAAHLFVFYYGAMADVTPPTALSSYTAAGIARSDPQRTTWLAWKLALAGFIIPFYFAMNPVLLLNVVAAPVTTLVLAVGSALAGIICLAMALQGYVIRPASALERILLGAAALLLINPGLASDLAGFGLVAIVVATQKVGARLALTGRRREAAGG